MGQETDKGACFVELVTGHVSSIGLIDNSIEYKGQTIVFGTDNECSGSEECILSPDEQLAISNFIGIGSRKTGAEIAAQFPKIAQFLIPQISYPTMGSSEDPMPCPIYIAVFMGNTP